ncbi:MAG: TetR/AcrR family transcriptional regulator [Minwuia sp.]|uniref:TetR/AcrR family transcriptional regulator n=1 Tax=Minwuia sp. TaxID=2493630 RepID=UPI003A862503
MPKAKAYHRGGLREDLVRLGAEMLEREGLDGLSVRKLAAEAGVSHNAPYMHFDDREALIAAIAAHGFAEQRRAIAAAVAGSRAKDWATRFRTGCRAYVRFATGRPVLYAAMHRGFDPDRNPEAFQASVGALGQLKDALDEGQRLGEIRTGDLHELAIGVWTALHGLAGILGRPDGGRFISAKPAEAIVDDTLDMLLGGIARRA